MSALRDGVPPPALVANATWYGDRGGHGQVELPDRPWSSPCWSTRAAGQLTSYFLAAGALLWLVFAASCASINLRFVIFGAAYSPISATSPSCAASCWATSPRTSPSCCSCRATARPRRPARRATRFGTTWAPSRPAGSAGRCPRSSASTWGRWRSAGWSLDFAATLALLAFTVPLASSRPMLAAMLTPGQWPGSARPLPLRLVPAAAVVAGATRPLGPGAPPATREGADVRAWNRGLLLGRADRSPCAASSPAPATPAAFGDYPAHVRRLRRALRLRRPPRSRPSGADYAVARGRGPGVRLQAGGRRGRRHPVPAHAQGRMTPARRDMAAARSTARHPGQGRAQARSTTPSRIEARVSAPRRHRRRRGGVGRAQHRRCSRAACRAHGSSVGGRGAEMEVAAPGDRTGACAARRRAAGKSSSRSAGVGSASLLTLHHGELYTPLLWARAPVIPAPALRRRDGRIELGRRGGMSRDGACTSAPGRRRLQ